MTDTRIAVPLLNANLEWVKTVEPEVDFWEVRMDLIGPLWPAVAGALHKPWIACNRRPQEGGKGQPDESLRIAELLRGLECGAAIVDIELGSPQLAETVRLIKEKAQCLISYHNFNQTPDQDFLNRIVQQAQAAGADICKIVTTAHCLADNLNLLRLIKSHPELPMVAFAMGEEGRFSRLLAPLAGAYFTFASLQTGQESASGQIPLQTMKAIYDLIQAR
jgi:3-dehydroquinate dehydratase I